MDNIQLPSYIFTQCPAGPIVGFLFVLFWPDLLRILATLLAFSLLGALPVRADACHPLQKGKHGRCLLTYAQTVPNMASFHRPCLL